jgi:hypothetical protein
LVYQDKLCYYLLRVFAFHSSLIFHLGNGDSAEVFRKY